MFKKNALASLARWKRVRYCLKYIVIAWRTRRSLNCLGKEVQDFVNCGVLSKKRELRNRFHFLFSKVL